MTPFNLIAIIGPTATGKSRLAALLAQRINAEIISADSRQVYRSMNLGTGKDYANYIVDGKPVPYHLLDIVEPGEEYNVFRFQQDFFNAFNDIQARGKMPILCGGTGMYIEAVLDNYNLMQVPANWELRNLIGQKSLHELAEMLTQMKPVHNTTDTIDRERAIRAIEIAVYEKENQPICPSHPVIRPLIFGIALDRSMVRELITQRLQQRLEQGMIDEVKSLITKGISTEKLDFYGLEYRYISRYIAGRISYDEMFGQLNTAIHQFAKRQMTWFRRMEKRGFIITWINGDLFDTERMATILCRLQ
ncbi:MAG: tRNA (adenosine(37)-N6)-dimethylallyltransferase MiaA [Bacteroidales bacterium]|nr:tRNA (adenosine(37)-N6)-dimethylallyltransferase MiaA [Bacteroidales bacterium]MDZ4203897.1 tRNA (adenosine(37)-N6)-dimethylallyltransferase MiaA [Bacteroidales bacterium]